MFAKGTNILIYETSQGINTHGIGATVLSDTVSYDNGVPCQRAEFDDWRDGEFVTVREWVAVGGDHPAIRIKK